MYQRPKRCISVFYTDTSPAGKVASQLLLTGQSSSLSPPRWIVQTANFQFEVEDV